MNTYVKDNILQYYLASEFILHTMSQFLHSICLEVPLTKVV